MKIAILHHADSDGFGAAYACWTALRAEHELKFLAVQYGQEPPLEELREFGAVKIYIVDFSYKAPVLALLSNEFKITVIDHHPTAVAELEEWCEDRSGGRHFVFNHSKSGAILTWEHFFPEDTKAPTILQYVQDRDLWKFELPNSKEVNAYIATLPWDFEVWGAFSIEEALLVGAALVKQQKRQIDARLKDVRMIEFGKIPDSIMETYGFPHQYVFGKDARNDFAFTQVPIVNATENISELGEAMCLAYPESPFSVSYADRTDGKRSYSLRSRNGFDVSEVAKAFGGGGHKAAAGFALAAPEVI